jgi:hypothetical protein
MSGGKGGSTSSTVTVPQYIEDAAKSNLAKADEIAKIGYTPYYGPDVAAFNQMQQAGFQNTAGMADAFGLAGGGTGMEGMPTPTTYAGGVQGYSSAPMFEQSMAELEARRPGQYAAINAPFIDPVTGAQPATPYGTGGADESPVSSGILSPYLTGGDNTGAMTVDEQMAMFSSSPSSDTGAMTVDQQNASFGLSPSGTVSAYLPGGVNDRNLGNPVNQFIAGATSPTQQSGAVTSSLRPIGRSAHSQYDPSTQSLTLDNGGGGGGGGGGTDSAGRDSSSCVVATHAVNSGAFSPATKREAVVWCMNALHGKWWGEAARRGYRYCGNKKIEQGKAREHYGEFRRYIDFASGKKRTLRGALTFTFRTAQFFAVGLVQRDA